MKRLIISLLMVASLAFTGGCWWDKDDPTKPDNKEFPAGMVWLGVDVSGWQTTSVCTPSVAGNTVNMEHTKKSVWPKAGNVDGGVCNANCWIVFNYNGTWYAATWEWLKVNICVKKLTNKLGTYIKKSPVIPSSWNPKSGEKIGLFVSGLCRDSSRNVSERSELVWITWP